MVWPVVSIRRKPSPMTALAARPVHTMRSPSMSTAAPSAGGPPLPSMSRPPVSAIPVMC
jgi:hypothetical protein